MGETMKSPYQIAREIGVTPQAVYKKLTNEFTNSLKDHIQRLENGKYLLDETAERTLKLLFNQVEHKIEQSDNNQVGQIEQPLLNRLNSQLNSENSFLRTRVESLEEELKTERIHARQQSDKLSDLAAQLAELTRNNQILLGAEQSRTNPALLVDDESSRQPAQSEESGRKKGFLGGVFGRRR